MEIKGTCVSKYLEETVRLQFEIRREWIREIRGDRLQGIAEAQVALPVLLARQPCRSPGEMSVRGPIVA